MRRKILELLKDDVIHPFGILQNKEFRGSLCRSINNGMIVKYRTLWRESGKQRRRTKYKILGGNLLEFDHEKGRDVWVIKVDDRVMGYEGVDRNVPGYLATGGLRY